MRIMTYIYMYIMYTYVYRCIHVCIYKIYIYTYVCIFIMAQVYICMYIYHGTSAWHPIHTYEAQHTLKRHGTMSPCGMTYSCIDMTHSYLGHDFCINICDVTSTHKWILSRVDESCRTYEWVKSHVWMSCMHIFDVTSTFKWVTSHTNESCRTYEWVVTHTNELYAYL